MQRIGWLAILAVALATGPASAQFGGTFEGMGGGMGGGMPNVQKECRVEVEAAVGKRLSGPMQVGNIAVSGDFGVYLIRPEKVRTIRLDPEGASEAVFPGFVSGVPIRGVVVTTSGEEIEGVLAIPPDWRVATDLGWVQLDPHKLKSITFLDATEGEGPAAEGPAGQEEPAGEAVLLRDGSPRILRIGSALWAVSASGDRVAVKPSEEAEARILELPATDEAPLGVVPLSSANLTALLLEGREITRIAIYSNTDGRWHPKDLREPAEGRASPVVGFTTAAYALGRYVYAFGANANRWDVLELPEGVSARPAVAGDEVVVEYDGHVHTFRSGTGRWTHTDVRDLLGAAEAGGEDVADPSP